MRPIVNLGLDADMSYVPYLSSISKAFGALGYPEPLLFCYTKVLTQKDLAIYKKAGFPVALVFEIGAKNSLGGRTQGMADAVTCLSQIRGLVTAPYETISIRSDAAVYVTCDTDAGPGGNLDTVEAYFDGFDSKLFAAGYRIGGYADGSALLQLHSGGLNFSWLAGATGWHGYSELLDTADVVQGIIPKGGRWQDIKWPVIQGLNYDPDIIYTQDIGQI